MYKANLSLHGWKSKTDLFSRANNERALYKGISGVNWSKLVLIELVIDTTDIQNILITRFVSQKCKDAIVWISSENLGNDQNDKYIWFENPIFILIKTNFSSTGYLR
jgi:hypothetical protein